MPGAPAITQVIGEKMASVFFTSEEKGLWAARVCSYTGAKSTPAWALALNAAWNLAVHINRCIQKSTTTHVSENVLTTAFSRP